MPPLHDDHPTQRFPLVTVVPIAVNVFVFALVQPHGGTEEARFVYERRASRASWNRESRSARWRSGRGDASRSADDRCSPGRTCGLAVLVSMFPFHGSWFHLLGNMWSSWIFGNNVEEYATKLGFVSVYSSAGSRRCAAHALSDLGSPHPWSALRCDRRRHGDVPRALATFPHPHAHVLPGHCVHPRRMGAVGVAGCSSSSPIPTRAWPGRTWAGSRGRGPRGWCCARSGRRAARCRAAGTAAHVAPVSDGQPLAAASIAAVVLRQHWSRRRACARATAEAPASPQPGGDRAGVVHGDQHRVDVVHHREEAFCFGGVVGARRSSTWRRSLPRCPRPCR